MMRIKEGEEAQKRLLAKIIGENSLNLKKEILTMVKRHLEYGNKLKKISITYNETPTV